MSISCLPYFLRGVFHSLLLAHLLFVVFFRYTLFTISFAVAFSKSKIQNEAKRLFEGLEKFEYTFEDCLVLAETTLKINHLKKKKNAIILAHSYQTPDITHGVADHLGGLVRTFGNRQKFYCRYYHIFFRTVYGRDRQDPQSR
jgi:hypothetical protein